jgi:nucleotide-binding universal stress UspA family protein
VIFSRVVVGFEGSDRSRDALVLGGALAGADCQLIACSVHRFNTLSARVDPSEPRLDRAAAERCADQAGRLLGDSRAVNSQLVASASAALALQSEAKRQRADLLALGSSHRGTVGRVLVGSVTEQTLHGAPCAVAVASVGFHRHGEDARLSRIAVAYDAMAPAPDALIAGATLAREIGGRLRVVAVADTAGAPAGKGRAALSRGTVRDKARRSATEQGLDTALAGLPPGVPALAEVRDGETVEELLEVTREADLLVLGSRGRGPVRRLVLGSVCDAIVRVAACPVLIVPPGRSGGSG